MPLPPALVARLAKRGLVDENLVKSSSVVVEKKSRTTTSTSDSAEEEVIAENYDSSSRNSRGGGGGTNANNNSNNANNNNGQSGGEEMTSLQVENQLRGHSGCPNKWNIYHECSPFCVRHWGKGVLKPDPRYLRKQARLLARYPLSSNWKEVYDPGTGRHYYWEMTSDMVSWLPPGHPKAVISESAATIREERHLAATDVSDHESDSQEDEDEETNDHQTNNQQELEPPASRKHHQVVDPRTKIRSNDLDPMDPASYSDAPRGRWSDGLEKGNEAKTGADVTAAGPLYQMRPYPSPGAVLRANAANKSNH